MLPLTRVWQLGGQGLLLLAQLREATQPRVSQSEFTSAIAAFTSLRPRDDPYESTRDIAEVDELLPYLYEQNDFWTSIVTQGLRIVDFSLEAYTNGQHALYGEILAGLGILKVDRPNDGILSTLVSRTTYASLPTEQQAQLFPLMMQTRQMAVQRDSLNLLSSQLFSIVQRGRDSILPVNSHAVTLRHLVGQTIDSLFKASRTSSRITESIIMVGEYQNTLPQMDIQYLTEALPTAIEDDLSSLQCWQQSCEASMRALLEALDLAQRDEQPRLPADVVRALEGLPVMALDTGTAVGNLFEQIDCLTSLPSQPTQNPRIARVAAHIKHLCGLLLSTLLSTVRPIARAGRMQVCEHHLELELGPAEQETLLKLKKKMQVQVCNIRAMESLWAVPARRGAVRQYVLLSMVALWKGEAFYYASLLSVNVLEFIPRLLALYRLVIEEGPYRFEESYKAIMRFYQCPPLDTPSIPRFRMEEAFIKVESFLGRPSYNIPSCEGLILRLKEKEEGEAAMVTGAFLITLSMDLASMLRGKLGKFSGLLRRVLKYWDYARLCETIAMPPHHQPMKRYIVRNQRNLLLAEKALHMILTRARDSSPNDAMRVYTELWELSAWVPMIIDSFLLITQRKTSRKVVERYDIPPLDVILGGGGLSH